MYRSTEDRGQKTEDRFWELGSLNAEVGKDNAMDRGKRAEGDDCGFWILNCGLKIQVAYGRGQSAWCMA